MKELVKRGSSAHHYELVTKMLLYSCLSRIPYHLSDTEVRVPQISGSGHRVPERHGYINLLIAEAKRPKENTQNKGVNFLTWVVDFLI